MLTLLRRNLAWMLLALVLSTGLWLVVTIDQNPPESNWFNGIPVEVKDVPSGMALRAEVPPVRVRVSAPRDVWAARALPADKFKAVVDASTAGPGIAEVTVTVTSSDSRAKIEEVDPARVTLRIEAIKKKEVPVRVRTIGSVPLGYEAQPPKASPSEVIVTGPQGLVEQVSHVQVEVPQDGVRSSISQAYPATPLSEAGTPVERVAVSPEKVLVDIPVTQEVGYKTISIQPQIVGTVAFGYQIVGIMADPATTTVVGDPPALSELNYLSTKPIDVSGAVGDVAVNAEPALPAGVTLARSQPLLVRVLISPIESSRTMEIGPQVKGAEGHQTTVSPEAIRVTISGPMPVLTRLRPQDVQVVVDATGLAAGTHSLQPTVALPSLLKLVDAEPGSVTVSIK